MSDGYFKTPSWPTGRALKQPLGAGIARSRFALMALLALGLLFLGRPFPLADSGGLLVVTSEVRVPTGWSLEGLLYRDFNRDGLADLILSVHQDGRDYARTLRIHLQRASAPHFHAEPSFTLHLTQDVVAIAAGDLHPDPGLEIALFTSTGVYAWLAHGRESGRYVKLREHPLLWQFSDPEEVFIWQAGVQDLDGDGLDDLLLPRSKGYQLAFQRRNKAGATEFSQASFLQLPELLSSNLAYAAASSARVKHDIPGGRLVLSLSLSQGEDVWEGPMLTISESLPAPQLSDWDGDGDLDLLALADRSLFVWLQEPRGHFSQAPQLHLRSPVEIDQQRTLDITFSAHVADINGDGRSDCLMVAGDKRARELRTQILIFIQEESSTDAMPLFGNEGIPQQLLVIGGFAGFPRLIDIDQDGDLDLALHAFRPDLIDAV
ncbi:MAG: VCBS repeat-containing protein, partial [Planctomycetota bacterium]